jgi:hypothetical protein
MREDVPISPNGSRILWGLKTVTRASLAPESAGRHLISALCFIAALSGAATAQTRFAGVVGAITDPTDAGVEGARVTARHAATGIHRSATSGSGGYYVLENLPPGIYEIIASQTGMRTVTLKSQEQERDGSGHPAHRGG